LPQQQASPEMSPQQKEKALRVARLAVIIVLCISPLLLVALLAIQPMRDELRKRYGFEPPEYYDKLPADTDENRAAVVKLLDERDRYEAMRREAVKPKPRPELNHGRTNSFNDFVITDPNPDPWPAHSLAYGFEYERIACHQRWGLLDRTFNLCKSVDASAIAADHYARDVENYWIAKLGATTSE
jgi:hypothetical protein